MRFKSEKLGKEEEELETRELISVMYLASLDWHSVLQNKFDGLLTRDWKFQEKSLRDLRDFQESLPEYVGEDRPERRDAKKKKRNRQT